MRGPEEFWAFYFACLLAFGERLTHLFQELLVFWEQQFLQLLQSHPTLFGVLWVVISFGIGILLASLEE